MTTTRRGPNPDHDPGRDPTSNAAHASHDRALIAARAAGDLSGPDLARADALREGCTACRRLHDELLAIATATRQLPAPARPQELDFRIAADRASELARGARWRRLLRPFGRSGSATVRPLAAAFTTLGLAGLLLAALPGLQLGSAGSAFFAQSAPSQASRDALGQTMAPEAVRPDAAPTPARTGGDTAGGESTIDTTGGYGPAVTADDMGAGPTPPANPQPTNTPGREDEGQGGSETGGGAGALGGGSAGASPLVIVSLAFLGAGLGLLLLRRIALRLR